MCRILIAVILLFAGTGILLGQTESPTGSGLPGPAPTKIALDVPAGTPLPVVLDKEVRIRKVGQPIHGRIVEPVYAFDKLVVPAGSEVDGRVTRIEGVSALQRAAAAVNANFSPAHEVQVTFDLLDLPGGRRVPLRTQVSPASQGVLRFASAPDPQNLHKKPEDLASLVSAGIHNAKQAAARGWEGTKGRTSSQGKLHWLKRLAIAEMPVHPQYFDAGTRFNAELLDPLDFGTEDVSEERLKLIGTPPPAGSIIRALLTTPLSSASAQRGEEVNAVMTEPLITNNQLILPEGTVLKGSVLQVQPARRFHRNGQLRIVFHQVVPPQAAEQEVEASLEGVEVKQDQNLSLDSEGGAQATTPKTRYLTTGISIALAVTTALPDPDAGASGQSIGELGGRATTGASGFRAIGFAIGALVKSRPLAAGMGAYGASMSVYANFLSRGHDVVYPKDTAMAIGFGSRVTGGPKTRPQT